MPQDIFERLARLAVEVGANVQPGQIVGVGADIGQEELARAVAAAAYKRGARFVDVRYFDPYVKRARIAFAPDDTLEFVPPWYGARIRELGDARGANVAFSAPSAVGALDGLDPARTGRDQLPFVKDLLPVISARLINWTAVPCPSREWARLAYPDLDEEAGYERLCEEIAHVLRLDAGDPSAAWRERVDRLDAVAARLNELRFDAIHFQGPGTDLTIGLFATSRWESARLRTVDGIEHIANLPTEEVYTTPDPQRAEGVVRSTRPLVLFDGSLVRGLEVRLEGGRAVAIDADEGVEVLRGRAAFDEGAARLGEVALVDRESLIGRLGTTFYDTLLDENAVSHIALGAGDEMSVGEEDRGRANRSAIHIDFMIGGDEVDATGIARDGERIPLLRDGAWQI